MTATEADDDDVLFYVAAIK